MGKCAYKQKRKGKRECPALDGKICSRCCGRHRLTDIDCPVDCRWLQKAIKEHRDKFFSSSSFRESDVASWLQEDLLSGTGPSPPGGNVGVEMLLQLLDVIHWKMKQYDEPESYENVVDDAIRYLEQTHTGQLVSPESPPSSLARALDKYLNTLFDTDQSTEMEQLKEELVKCLVSFFDWCESRNLDYFETLDPFYSEYNLDGWTPVEEQGGELVIRSLQETGDRKNRKSENGISGSGGSESDLIVPG